MRAAIARALHWLASWIEPTEPPSRNHPVVGKNAADMYDLPHVEPVSVLGSGDLSYYLHSEVIPGRWGGPYV